MDSRFSPVGHVHDALRMRVHAFQIQAAITNTEEKTACRESAASRRVVKTWRDILQSPARHPACSPLCCTLGQLIQQVSMVFLSKET